jgi:hypothetical protein
LLHYLLPFPSPDPINVFPKETVVTKQAAKFIPENSTLKTKWIVPALLALTTHAPNDRSEGLILLVKTILSPKKGKKTVRNITFRIATGGGLI